jgi:hypothetical protein
VEITKIKYREVVNTGNYESVAIDMEADVDKSDDLEMCMAKLRNKVKRELKESWEG